MGPPKFEFGFLPPRGRRMGQATLRPRLKIKGFLVTHDVIDKVLVRKDDPSTTIPFDA